MWESRQPHIVYTVLIAVSISDMTVPHTFTRGEIMLQSSTRCRPTNGIFPFPPDVRQWLQAVVVIQLAGGQARLARLARPGEAFCACTSLSLSLSLPLEEEAGGIGVRVPATR